MLIEINEILNNKMYITLLWSHLSPHKAIKILHYDGSSCHTSNATKTFLPEEDFDVLKV